MGRNLAWLGVVLFAVSWFVPVVAGQDTARALEDLGEALSGERSSPGGPPGWQACRFAWDLLTDTSGEGPDGLDVKVCGATCLTNVAMVAAVLALLASRGRRPLLGLLLLACVALNLSWIYLGEGEMRSSLAAGYYLWTASFGLVGLGLLGGRE